MQVSVNMGLVAREASLGQAKPANLDLEELLATRLLVQGNSGSGKSHLLRRLLEQSAQWVQQCVIDPEGDFVTLADKFGHVVVEAGRTAEELARIAERIRRHRVSVVLNLEGLEAENQMRAAAAFLNGLFDAERDYWYPLLVVVDEAQLFAPAGAVEVPEEARRASLSAMTNLMCRGRKRGLAGVIATQRLAKLAKNVAAEASNFLMGRTFLDIDMARAADLLGMERRQAEMFRDLERGHFIALGPALSRRPLPIKIGEVETAARSSSPKLMPLPDVAAGDAEDLIFTPAPAERELRSANGLIAVNNAMSAIGSLSAVQSAMNGLSAAPQSSNTVKPIEDILREVADARAAEMAKQEEHAPAAPLFPEIDETERQELFWQILAEILAEQGAYYQPVAALYQDFTVRCRIHRLKGNAPDLPQFRRLLNYAQAGLDAALERNPLWAQACALSENLAEDVQGIFLRLAAAAIKALPCPPDATLARLYGTVSARRAQSLLKIFEDKGLLVVRTDFNGKRIVTFPDLGAETAPGNAEGEDSADVIWDGRRQAVPSDADAEKDSAGDNAGDDNDGGEKNENAPALEQSKADKDNENKEIAKTEAEAEMPALL